MAFALFFLNKSLEIPENRWAAIYHSKLQVMSETTRVYYNAVSVSSRALFGQYLFMCRSDSMIILIKS